MAVLSHPKPAPEALPRQPELNLIETTRRRARLHLLAYLVANTVFWTLLVAISGAEAWSWWLVAPFAWWTLAVALHLWHAYRVTPEQAARRWSPRRGRVAGLVLITALVAGPVSTHVYWMLGGTWGLNGTANTLGIKVVAAAVVLGLVGAVLIVLARAGFWEQAFLPDRVVRLLTWGLAVFFLGHGVVSFAEGAAGMEIEWWLYGPSGLVIGLVAVVVASSVGARPPSSADASRGSHRRAARKADRPRDPHGHTMRPA